jgi:hypothetical protein
MPLQEKNKPVAVIPTAVPIVTADSSLYISPNPIQMASDSATCDIIINSGRNKLTGIQLEIGYDPNLLTNVKVNQASFFPSPTTLINSTDKKNGRISFALVISPAGSPVSGTGTVATITFEHNPVASTSNSQTEITILDKSLVSMLGVSESVLKDTHGTTVILRSTPISPIIYN